jgi:hypothetical protein
MNRSEKKKGSAARRAAALALQLAVLAACAAAQSSDPERPAPALSNEIAGRIAPLDVGDSRLTRHFYAFGAQPGDLELTVESSNLEGDVDLFAAATLRPLAKVTLYAGLGSAVTRTVFLRRAESLVLRVQARSPDDSEGSYRIRLGGTFVPAVASDAAATPGPTPGETASASPVRGAAGRRVTSTGARIEEPRPEAPPDADAARAAEPEATPEPAAPAAPPRRTAPRARTNTRESGRRGSTRAGRASDRASRDEPPSDTPPASAPGEAPPARTNARANRSGTPRGRANTASRRGGQSPADTGPSAATVAPGAPAPAGLELPGTRLVLELREGGRLEREMSAVRRVTVERGLIVITLKSGKVERQPLANVLRMSIEP